MSYKQTLLPEYVGLVEATSINFYNTGTNILSALGTYIAEISQNIQFTSAISSYDMLSGAAVLFNDLNSSNFLVPDFDQFGNSTGTKQLDDSFKLYFIEKFQNLSEQFQTRIQTAISNNVFFQTFSDVPGDIADTVSVIDNNTSPYYDVDSSQYFLPTNVPPALFGKLTVGEQKILKTFSYYGDALLKYNMAGLQASVNQNTASTAHGDNLVTDILFYNRAVVYQLQILNLLKNVLGDLSNFIIFFKQLNPKDLDPNRRAILFKFTLTNMEQLQVRVDGLKEELSKIEVSSSRVLS